MPDLSSNAVVSYAVALANRNSEALSFIPAPKLQDYHRRGRLLTVSENGDLCGFLVWGGRHGLVKVYQVCVQDDARRLEHGAALIGKLEAMTLGAESLSAWCAADLESNAFWQALGFVFSGSRMGGVRRGRVHHLWIKWLNAPVQFVLRWEAAPSVRAGT